ncbi:MAG: hypothetical protein S0880_02230 [Actinomycetota bacterium]|nr:hypothetical protein [Actinomycetota bacterium]
MSSHRGPITRRGGAVVLALATARLAGCGGDTSPTGVGDNTATIDATVTTSASTVTSTTVAAGPRADILVNLGVDWVVEPSATRLDDADTVAAMRAALIAEDPRSIDEALEALDEPVPEGEIGFAFAFLGCEATDAVLELTDTTITATLIEDPDVACDAPDGYLAVFTVPAADVAPDAELVHP